MKIFSFEELKIFMKDIVDEHNLKNISFVNVPKLGIAAGTYLNTIEINYNLALAQLNKKYPNDIAAINFGLLQLVCHEIVHKEHENIYYMTSRPSIQKDARLVSLRNEEESVQFAQNFPKIYYQKSDMFIDEYIADLLGSFYAIDYIYRKLSSEFSEEQLKGLSQAIAMQILSSYCEMTPTHKIKIVSPIDRFVKLLNGFKIKLDQLLFSDLRITMGIPKERDLTDFEANIIRPSSDAINNSEYEKLLYGDYSQLLNVVKEIAVRKTETVNIFTFLRQYNEDLVRSNDEGNISKSK